LHAPESLKINTQMNPDFNPVPSEDSGACNAPLRMDLPQRRSVRLPGYDYSQAGWYFVTIMATDGQLLFGAFNNAFAFYPTPLGEVVSCCWHELAALYPSVHADCWVLMPNHVHLLIGLLPTTTPKSLGRIVGAFKAACTRRAQLQRGAGSLWQRSYHEHVVRTAYELEIYRDYVRNNPRRWVEKRGSRTER
jgi:putative transposase